jgi:carbon-monoxide dehydrogenase medium subunit
MYDFTYQRPDTLDAAAKALAAGEDAMLLAGGHTLIPTLKLRLARPSDLVDLATVPDLVGISKQGNAIVVKAMTTHGAVAASKEVAGAIPALAALAGLIGDPQVRVRGTIGGSVANNDPAADYPAALVGLGATVTTNKRSHAADDFFTGMFETALDEGEIITSVSFPIPRRAAYQKFPNPASRYALVGVFVAEAADGVRVAVTGAGPCVFRVPEMEKALKAKFQADAIKGISVDAGGLNDDIHASAEYRAHLVSVMAARAVAAA